MINREILGNRYQVQQQLGKKAGRKTLFATDLVTGKSVIVKLDDLNPPVIHRDIKPSNILFRFRIIV